MFNTCECICQAKLMFLCPFCLHTDQRNVEKASFFPSTAAKAISSVTPADQYDQLLLSLILK